MKPGSLRAAWLTVVGLAASATAGAPDARAQNIELLSQLDPSAAVDAYADIWGEGDYAYMGSFEAMGGVWIIDVSDPTAPFVETVYGAGAGGKFVDVKVHDGVGYFASDNGGGLHIVDVSDPTSPTLLAQVTSADGGYDDIHNVSIDAGYLYQADSHTETVIVFDVSTPSSPSYVRDILTPATSFIHDITARGGRMYASAWNGRTFIYDVSNVGSAAPPLIGDVPSGGNSHSSWPSSDGNLLVTARERVDGDVRIYDISNPAVPVLLATMDDESLGIEAYTPHNPVLFDDDLLFVAWYQAGVVALDIRDPSNPVMVGNYDTFPGAVSFFDGNWGVYPWPLDRVLLSDHNGGLFVVDASALAAVAAPALGPSAFFALVALLSTAGASLARARSSPFRR